MNVTILRTGRCYMKNGYLWFVAPILALLLGSCSILPGSRPASDSAMKTEIVQILTAMVTDSPIILDQPIVEETTIPTQVMVSTQTALPASETTPALELGQMATSTLGEVNFESTPATLPQEGNPPSTIEPIPTSIYQQQTQTAVGTPTKPADDPVLILGSPTWKDTFENGDNWPLGIDLYVDLKAGGGSLQMTGLTTKNGWRLSGQKTSNFYLELTGKMPVCSGADQFGLFFRSPNLALANRGYLYGISCEGKFALRKWDTDTMTVLENWKTSDAILRGSDQTNRIGVMAKGNVLKLYVNGVLVDTITDSSFSQGYIGLYIGSKETLKLTAVLDEIAYWVLP